MQVSEQVWPKIEASAQQFFKPLLIRKGKETLDVAQISVSFKKGKLGSFFVISGLISDGTAVESRLKGKKTEDGNQTLDGQCTCTEWSKEEHCRHISALFLKFCLDEYFEEGLPDVSEGIKEIEQVLKNTQSAHAKEYGTLIFQANRLMNAPFNASFTNQQYLLTNGKLASFPIAKGWEGKLKIELQGLPEKNLHPDFYGPNHQMTRFVWQKASGEEKSKISLFDTFNLFDWESGEAYQVPPPIQEFLKKIKATQVQYGIDDFIRLVLPLQQQDLGQLFLEDKALGIEERNLTMDLEIVDGQRKNYFQFVFSLKSETDAIRFPFPEIFSLFAFHGGFLCFFNNRTEMQNFLSSTLKYLEGKGNFEKSFSSSKERDYALDWLSFFKQHEQAPIFFDSSIILTPKRPIIALFSLLYEMFGPYGFRTSVKNNAEKTFTMELPRAVVLEKLAELFEQFKEKGLAITYRQKQVHAWHSQVHFERKEGSMGWFDLTMKLTQQDYEILQKAELGESLVETSQGLVVLSDEQKTLVKMLKKYQKYDRLKEKDDVPAPKTDKQQLDLSLNRARIFELFELERMGVTGALNDEEREVCQRLLSFEELPDYDLPNRFESLARAYQKEGFRWIQFLYESKFGACLADDMGLGKTLQVIMVLQALKDKLNKILIVCPVSIISNWKSELQKFSDLDAELYYGEGRQLNWDKKIIITSYGIMKKEVEEIWSKEDIDIVVFDEIQHLKNIKSLGAQAARKITANFRVALTGTPVENDLIEFYNILDLVVPGIWGDLSGAKTKSSQKARFLARKTARPFILRRTKEKVLKELPEKVEQHVYLDFTSPERRHYRSKLENLRELLQSTERKQYYGLVLKGLLELRKLCLWQNQMEMLSTKISFLLENLEQLREEKHQSLVFSQFTTYLDIIEQQLKAGRHRFARIDGSMSLKNRMKEIERFQKGEAEVFLISLKAGGVGLNLTAASYVFIMDPWWNPAVENQAIDRAYRIGQENKVTVYRPLIKDSVEEKVLILQQEKKKLFEDLMAPENDESFYDGKLSKDDFQMLLGD